MQALASLKSILANKREEKLSARQQALRDYHNLLKRADAPHRGDDDLLGKCIAALGIDLADVEIHAEKVAHATELETRRVPPGAVAKLEAIALEAIADFKAAELRLNSVHLNSLQTEELALSHADLRHACNVAEIKKDWRLKAFHDAKGENTWLANQLRELRQAHPYAFGQEPTPKATT